MVLQIKEIIIIILYCIQLHLKMENSLQQNCSIITESLSDSLDFINVSSNCSSGGDDDVMNGLYTIPQLIRTLIGIANLVVFILGLSLSVFLIVLILYNKSLRNQRGFAITFLIILSNLIFATFVLSTSVVVALDADTILSGGICQFIAFCNLTFQPLRWLLTTVLIVDRALIISWPFKYEKYRTQVLIVLSMLAIMAALFNGIIPSSVLQECIGFSSVLNTCQLTELHTSCLVYGFTYTTSVILIGGILPFCIYLWLFYKASKANRQVVPIQNGEEGSIITPHSSISRKQLLTFFVLFWTLLGCALPNYTTLLLTYLIIVTDFTAGIIVVGPLYLLTQPLINAQLIADPVALMWHKDVKEKLKNIKLSIKTQFRKCFSSTSQTLTQTI